LNFTLEAAFSPGALVGHAGYVLLITSMLMTRMTWLRVLAIGSGILEALYYIVWLNDPVGAFWETMFVLTNVAQLAIMIYANSMARFTPDERAFYDMAVPGLDPADARRLIKSGRWATAEPGMALAKEGEVVPDLAFIASGEVAITVSGQTVGECGPGSFVGEISFTTGGPATATAVARSPVRYLAFRRDLLTKLVHGNSEIGRAMELAFRHGLREKLVRTNQAMAAHVIPAPAVP
jgi:CRP-like cAMP-binding protein